MTLEEINKRIDILLARDLEKGLSEKEQQEFDKLEKKRKQLEKEKLYTKAEVEELLLKFADEIKETIDYEGHYGSCCNLDSFIKKNLR